MKTKRKRRHAQRTRSPLQHAARTGACCREAVLRPTQPWLGRPALDNEKGRPIGKLQLRKIWRATSEHATKEKREKRKRAGKRRHPKLHFSRSPIPAAGEPDRRTTTAKFKQTAACASHTHTHTHTHTHHPTTHPPTAELHHVSENSQILTAGQIF